MKLAGLDTANPDAQKVLSVADDNDIIALGKVPALVCFVPDHVELAFVGKRHVPQLRAVGRVTEIVPHVEVPYDIREITFDKDRTQDITVDYNFTTEQIQRLVGKGLYLDGFTPPELMYTSVWEMAGEIDMTVIAPSRQRPGPPIITVDMRDAVHMDTDMDRSGYDFVSVFDDRMAEYIEAGRMQSQSTVEVTRTVQMDEYGDLFAGHDMADFDESLLVDNHTQSRRREMPTIAQRLAQFETTAELIAAIDSAERSDTRTTAEILAEQRDAERYAGMDPEERRRAENYDRIIAAARRDRERHSALINESEPRKDFTSEFGDFDDLSLDDEIVVDDAGDYVSVGSESGVSEGAGVKTDATAPETDEVTDADEYQTVDSFGDIFDTDVDTNIENETGVENTGVGEQPSTDLADTEAADEFDETADRDSDTSSARRRARIAARVRQQTQSSQANSERSSGGAHRREDREVDHDGGFEL